MKNTSKDSFDDKLDENKVDAEKAEANKKAEEDNKTAEEEKRLMEHEQGGMVGNNAEQYQHSIQEPVNPDQPDLSDRPMNDPSVYPSDPNKGLTPNPLPSPPQVEPLPHPAVDRGDEEKMSVDEILTRLLHIANVSHHAGNQMDVRAVGHALRDLVHLLHRMISEK